MTDPNKQNIGLYEKYRVDRWDGTSDKGKKHHGCQYFVLDLDHDPFALPALEAYAAECRAAYPALASDLIRIVQLRMSKRLAGQEATAKRPANG